MNSAPALPPPAPLSALAALEEKLVREPHAHPHAHVFFTVTSNRRVPLSELKREAMRLRRAIKGGGYRIRFTEFGPFSREAAK